VHVNIISNARISTSGLFLNVLYANTSEFETYFQDLKFDAGKVARILLDLHDKKDAAVIPEPSDIHVSIHFDRGFGNHSYDHNVPVQEQGWHWALEAVPMGSGHGGQGGGTPRTEGTWDPVRDGQWGRAAPGGGH
jgi:hypothetical protein